MLYKKACAFQALRLWLEQPIMVISTHPKTQGPVIGAVSEVWRTR